MVRTLLAALLLLLISPMRMASAQYPERAIKLVVPFAAGGPTDSLARTLAEGLKSYLSKPVIIENKPGAGANIGAEYVANSPPDGYTLLFATTGPLAINVSLFKKLNYDPLTSFAPVMMIGKIPNVLAVRPDVPARTMSEFISYAKTAKNLNYGSGGVGASTHLAGEMLNARAGPSLQLIPYRGTLPAINDVLGGQISVIMADVFLVSSYIQAGSLRALGVTTPERSPLLPNVATFEEQGLEGFDSSVIFAILAPSGTPKDIVTTLNTALVAALRDPAVKAATDLQGMIPAQSSTPEFLTAFMKGEIPRTRDLIEKIGIEKQ